MNALNNDVLVFFVIILPPHPDAECLLADPSMALWGTLPPLGLSCDSPGSLNMGTRNGLGSRDGVPRREVA